MVWIIACRKNATAAPANARLSGLEPPLPMDANPNTTMLASAEPAKANHRYCAGVESPNR